MHLKYKITWKVQKIMDTKGVGAEGARPLCGAAEGRPSHFCSLSVILDLILHLCLHFFLHLNRQGVPLACFCMHSFCNSKFDLVPLPYLFCTSNAGTLRPRSTQGGAGAPGEATGPSREASGHDFSDFSKIFKNFKSFKCHDFSISGSVF